MEERTAAPALPHDHEGNILDRETLQMHTKMSSSWLVSAALLNVLLML